ncbi:MAG: CinA family protein [Rhizobiaceae bacterium]|nr:CinA family protein [Rhizobiaceae bacterium]
MEAAAARIVRAFTAASKTIATAESCTGGLIAAFLTDVPGSSAVLDRGFVTYSNAAKTEMIGVPAALIEAHGAVSQEVALAMSQGARKASRADVVIAVTGIAGPGGGSAEKPVGLVHLAISGASGSTHRIAQFGDAGREVIRLATVATAFSMLEDWLVVQAGVDDP